VGHPTEVFIGIDVAKARNAIAIADGERGGEVRFVGEVDASPDAMKRILLRIAAKYDVVHCCYEVTVRLLTRSLGLEAGGEFGVVDEVIEELLPGLGRETRFAEHVRQLVDAVIG
jgi:hypothetical protein